VRVVSVGVHHLVPERIRSPVMDQNLLDAVISLVRDQRWLALAALVIGLVVRLLKSDGPIPWNLPARFRPWLAVGLGIVASCVDKVATGTPWRASIAAGLVAAFAAISGHQLLVESLRGGREIGESKPAFAKRSNPPPPMRSR